MAGGEQITITQGDTWTENFRDENPGATKAYVYSKTKLNLILDQTNCTGIRIYNAINDDDESCLVLVGTDSSGNDMTSGVILDRGDPCPNVCDSNSSLNGE